jgi:hypothetical protein
LFLLCLAIPSLTSSARAVVVGTYDWGGPELIIDAPQIQGGVVYDDPACMGDWDFQYLAPNHVRIVYTALCDGRNDHIAGFNLRVAVAGVDPSDWAPGYARIWMRGAIGGGGPFNEIWTGSGTGVPVGLGDPRLFAGSGEFLITSWQHEPPPFGFTIDVGGVLSLDGQTWVHEVRIDQIGIVAADDVRSPVPVVMGSSWDGQSLQQILDAHYGSGAIDVLRDYEGYLPGDGDPAYWEDSRFRSLLVQEIAGFDDSNVLGWYREDLDGAPVIDGVDDGEIFAGPVSPGAAAEVTFPAGVERFGFYLRPNYPTGSNNAPYPETFYTNRNYNDIGPAGGLPLHPPADGDLQCLIFNISHLRAGVPTYVLAWEDLDSGAVLTSGPTQEGTDNDFNDLVVEVSAFSPVPTESESWGRLKSRYDGK